MIHIKKRDWNVFNAIKNLEATEGYALLSTLVFPLILFFYPFWNVNVGVDVVDTSYNLANFTYYNLMQRTWFFSTFLANMTGAFFVRLPGGGTMLGINIYTTLFVSALALIGYYFFKKKMPAWIVFLGEIAAISLAWCPSVILYNYLTYLFFTLAVIFLYCALTENKTYFFILAGMSLGFNLFVRFPNITETALILGVWYFGWLKRSGIKKVLFNSFLCLAGYLLGAGIVFGSISIIWGAGNYFDAITGLFKMTSGATSYTPFAMVIAMVQGYLEGFIWFIKIILVGIFGMALFVLVPKRFRFVISLLYGALVLFFLAWLYKANMYDFNYHYFLSVYRWVVIFLIVTLIIILTTVISRRTSQEEKLLAILLLIVIGITPLGSNNQLYPNINFLFLLAPFNFYGIYRFVSIGFQKENRSSFDALRIMTVIFTIAFLFQSILFGLQFVFNEGYQGEKRDTKIENNDIISRMLTTSSNAQTLQDLNDFIQMENLTGKSVLLFGRIPGISYFLKMPFAVSSSWPDLDSYPYETFKNEIDALQTPPVIIVDRNLADWILGDTTGSLDFIEEYNKGSKQLQLKETLLKEYVQKNEYTLTYSNEDYGVFQEVKPQ
jgi:hypothetical protein